VHFEINKKKKQKQKLTENVRNDIIIVCHLMKKMICWNSKIGKKKNELILNLKK